MTHIFLSETMQSLKLELQFWVLLIAVRYSGVREVIPSVLMMHHYFINQIRVGVQNSSNLGDRSFPSFVKH